MKCDPHRWYRGSFLGGWGGSVVSSGGRAIEAGTRAVSGDLGIDRGKTAPSWIGAVTDR